MPGLIHMNLTNVVPELSVCQLPTTANHALLDNRNVAVSPTGIHTLPDPKENQKGLEFDHNHDTKLI